MKLKASMKMIIFILCLSSCSIFGEIFRDILLPSTQSSAVRMERIHASPNGYFGFLLKTNIGNDITVFLYDTNGNTSCLQLNAGIYPSIAGAPNIGFVGDRLIVTGSANSSPATIFPVIYEYQLGNQTPLPTSLTLITNFSTGTNNCVEGTVVEMTNGTVAVCYALHTTNSQVNITQRLASGTWTNYTTFPMLGIALTPTFITAAEMPGSGALWVFLNKDSSSTLWASEFTNTASGLVQGRQFKFADDDSAVKGLQPYGEICLPQAISDSVSNRIILAYNNTNYIRGSQANVATWCTHLCVVGMNDATNRHLLTTSSDTVYRFGNLFGITQETNSLYLSYIVQHTNSTTTSGSFPVIIETMNGLGQSTAPPFDSGIDSQSSRYLMFNPVAKHYVLRYPDLSWHLVMNPPGRSHSVATVKGLVIIRGNATIR